MTQFEESPLPRPAATAASSSNKYVLMFGAVMLVGILFLAWLGRPPRAVIVGQPMPTLDLQPLLAGAPEISNQDLLGKLTVLHFWGTWCPPCQQEFPGFVNLAKEFADQSEVAIVSVSCSGGPEYHLETLRAETEAFMQKYATSIPTYCDTVAMTRQQLALLLPNGSLGYPTTVLVGRDGKVLDTILGYYPGDMEKLADTIKRQL